MKKSNKKWERWEDLILIKSKQEKLSHALIGARLNRTPKSIENRWRELRRGMGKRTSGNKLITSVYTPEDKRLIKSLYEMGYYQWQIANVMGRSESSVGNMLYLMRGESND